jgi:hypothetical protein
VLHLDSFSRSSLHSEPFAYAVINGLFEPADGAKLAATYPTDHYRIVSGGEEKAYRYDARPLVPFGGTDVCFPDQLSAEWRALATDLANPAYRNAIGAFTHLDLSDAPLEVNIFHYGPRCLLEPHRDLDDKIVTHVLYFNDAWDPADGGCLRILRSSDVNDCVCEVPPIVGSSAIIVQSDRSWHAVPEVKPGVHRSRRSMTVTFYRPGSTSTLFPQNGDYRLQQVGDSGSGRVQRFRALVDRLTSRAGRMVRGRSGTH